MSYHTDISKLTKTQLATWIKSPVEFRETFITRLMAKKSTKQMALGSVCHAVLLERKHLEDCFVIYPDSCLKSDGSINGKPAKEYREQHPEAIGFGKYAEYVEIERVLVAVHRHELGKLIAMAHERETEVVGEYNGRAIKCKPDFWCPGIIYDLKFMEDISIGQIKRSFKNFSYWLQDAHYSAVVGGNPGFRFWLVETKYPYRIKTVVYDARSREIGRASWQKSMDKFIECEQADVWSEPTEIELTLSPWDMPDETEEAELEGFEDEQSIEI